MKTDKSKRNFKKESKNFELLLEHLTSSKYENVFIMNVEKSISFLLTNEEQKTQ